MKRSQWLAAAVVALMLLSAFPSRIASAQGAYSERLNVYVAGSNALWYFSFSGVNGSSRLGAFESTPGLTSYNITAIDTSGWKSDFQVFGPAGYNLLPVPYLSPRGVFLTVSSDSSADASAAATALGSYFLTSFTPLNATGLSLTQQQGVYRFYAPVSFSTMAPLTLLRLLPTSEKGFANALTANGLLSTPSPFVVLQGTGSSSGFSRTLLVGSIAASAFDSSDRPNVLGYFGSTIKSLNASSHSLSSSLHLSFLDGTITSTDKATVKSDSSRFTASYALALAPGKSIHSVNATVVELPAQLLATRAVDVGVLRTGDTLAVTLTLIDASSSLAISKVAFSDSWWRGTGVFKFLGGNYTVPAQSIGPGGSITPVYRLEYNGTTAGPMTIPASVVRYQYTVEGKTFNATAVMNPIRLSLGVDDAVVFAILAPVGGLGKAVGLTQKLNMTVVNVGTLPASSVVAAGHSIPGLAARSGSSSGTATVTISQSASGLTGTNATRAYSVSYQDPAGNQLNATTNMISDIFSHNSMNVGYPSLALTPRVSILPSRTTNFTLSFMTSNVGPANVTSFRATGTLPEGLACAGAKVKGTGLTCTGDQVTLSYRVLNATSTVRASLAYNLTTPSNYAIPPVPFSGMSSGYNVSGRSNPVEAPTGLVLSKSFSPSQLFPSMVSQVRVAAANDGPLKFYNLTVSTTIDSFDTLNSSSSLSTTLASVDAGGNASFAYAVSMLQAYGAQPSNPPAANFYFGGTSYSIQGNEPDVVIYQPLSVSISTSPSTPEEGKNFTIAIAIKNPSAVSVSGVSFTLPVPSGLSLSNLRNATFSGGVLSVSPGPIGPHGTATATAQAVAGSGILVPFGRAKLTFNYSGVTLRGVTPSKTGIGISEDVTIRYIIPTAFVLLVLLATAFYVRRKASTGPSSQK